MLVRVFKGEVYKFFKSKVWIALFIGPLFCWSIGNYYAGMPGRELSWIGIYSRMIGVYALYLLPLLTGIITAFICRYEHDKNMWKQYLSAPVGHWHVYMMKFLTSFSAIGITQILILASIYIIQIMHTLPEQVPLGEVALSLVSGWISIIPLIALQLWVTSQWKSFAGVMVINTVLTMPNAIIAGQPSIAMYYPWAQPLLSMAIDNENALNFAYIDPQVLLSVSICAGMIFITCGLMAFRRKAY